MLDATRRNHFAEMLILLLILAAGAVLRFYRAPFDGLIFDEQWHVELATGRGSGQGDIPEDTLIPRAISVTSLDGAPPWYAVWTHMTHVVHPPLYCISLRWWMEVFGQDEVPVKSLSIVCGLIAIALLYDAVRQGSGSAPAALWAASLFALAPSQVNQHQVVRGYAMAQMFGCGLLAAVVRIEQRGSNPPRCIGLGVCALALALTHYFGLFADLAVGLYVLLRLGGRVRRDSLIALAVAGIVFAIAWGPFMWAQRRDVAETADPWLVETQLAGLARIMVVLYRAAAAPTWQFLAPPNFHQTWALIGAPLVLLPSLILWKRRPDLRIWIVWICGTLIAVTLLDLTRSTRQLLFTRYTALAGPAVFALATAPLCKVRFAAVRHGIPLILVLIALANSGGAYQGREEPEWRELGNLLRNELSPASANAVALTSAGAVAPASTYPNAEAVLFYSGSHQKWFASVMYLGTGYYAADRFPRPIVILSKPADAALLQSMPGPTALLVSGPLDRPIEELLPGAKVILQYMIPNLALVTRVALPVGAGGG